jgi:integrase
VADYIIRRQSEKTISPVRKIEKTPAAATINREVAILMRALRLAVEHGRLTRVPIIHKPKEAAPRKGFFEPEAFEAVRAHLSPDLQVATALMYDLAWRLQEVLELEARQVDLAQACIRLDPGSTKNDDGRVVFLRPTLVEMLRAHLDRVRDLARLRLEMAPRTTAWPTHQGPNLILPVPAGLQTGGRRLAVSD